MKNTWFAFLCALVVLAVSSFTGTAQASWTFTGNIFGMVVQNPIDLSGDGIPGRDGLLQGRGSIFTYVYTNIDAGLTDPLNPQGTCNPGETELTPFGQAAFVALGGNNVLFVEIDSTQTLCFGLVPEVVFVDIIGGRGALAAATGFGTIVLPDDVLLNVDPVFGAPRVVYVHDGSFTLHVY